MGSLEDVYFPVEFPENRPFQVVGFGENAVDWVCRVPHYPAHDSKVKMERLLRMGGGQIATACSFCSRFGLKTRYVGRVGDDDLGRFMREDLGREDMDLVLETVPGSFNHHSLIIVDQPTGGRTIIFDRDPRLRYGDNELDEEPIVQGQILHLDGNDVSASAKTAIWAQQAGQKVCLDIDRVQPGVETLLRHTDFLIASRSFVAAFGGSGDWRADLRCCAEVCPGFVAVTRGENGAAALWEGRIYEFPAFRIEVVDSTGAGDMFHGAFIYSVLQGWSVERTMRFSNAAGALACTRYGARAAIPTLEEILKLERLAGRAMPGRTASTVESARD